MSEAVELCRKCLDMLKEDREYFMPSHFFLAFILGCDRGTKELEYFLKKEELLHPIGIEYFDSLLKRGMQIFKRSSQNITCPACKKEHVNNEDMKFCPFCGLKLNQ